MAQVMTAHDAAKRIYPKLDKARCFTIFRSQVEGRWIPEGTFNEFVHELKSFGICIDKFAPNKMVTVTGQHPTIGGITIQVV